MDPSRVAVYAVAGCVVVLTLATGPAGPVTVDEPGGPPSALGTGNATVEVVSPPDAVTVRGGTAGQGLYYVEVPQTPVVVSDLRGNPTLTYAVSIDEVGLSTSSVHTLGSEGEGRTVLGIDRLTTDSPVQNASRAQLRLVLYGETDRTVFQKTVPVEVEE